MGLRHVEIRKAVLRVQPLLVDYAAALVAAQNEQAVVYALGLSEGRTLGPEDGAINAIAAADKAAGGGKDKASGGKRPCWECGSNEHLARDCPNFKGGRKKGAALRKQHQQLVKQVNAIGEFLDEAGDGSDADDEGERGDAKGPDDSDGDAGDLPQDL